MSHEPRLGLLDGSSTTLADSNIIVIGCSLGGLAAMTEVFSHLPADLPAAVAVVQHRPPECPGQLEGFLGRQTPLRVRTAEHGGHLTAGTIHIAPGGLHLLVGPGGLSELSESPEVQYCRPSVDRLFESASCLGGRVLAVVLTGLGRDGTDGTVAVSRAGGRVIAQNEATSLAFGMPGSAIRSGVVDCILPLMQIAPELLRWARSRR